MCAVRSGGKGGAEWRGSIVNSGSANCGARKEENIRRGIQGIWVRIPSVRRRVAYRVLREEAKRRLDHLTPQAVEYDGKAEGVCVLRASSFTASVLLCDFHLFALCDCDTVADCSGERIDSSVRTLCGCKRVSGGYENRKGLD